MSECGKTNILKTKGRRCCEESGFPDLPLLPLFFFFFLPLNNRAYQSNNMLHHRQNNTSKRSSIDQEHLHCWSGAFPQQGLQAPDHYVPVEHLNMREAKFAPKHPPLSPGDDPALDFVHPIPKPTPSLYLSTSNFALFDANLKRETTSPFDTGRFSLSPMVNMVH